MRGWPDDGGSLGRWSRGVRLRRDHQRMTTEHAARLASLTTAHLADACIRLDLPVRCAPAGTRPLAPGTRVAGRVLPARHAGSVDVFLEAFEYARQGDVLVVDNGGRTDQACIGDLVVAEAGAAGLAGLLVWGLHRDTADILAIGLPVFSLGAIPTGPLEVGPRDAQALLSARVGAHTVSTDDVVVADDDGAVFLPDDRVADIVHAAEGIRDVERGQAEQVRRGDTLRQQVGFASFLENRKRNATLTFREHLRTVGGAIEE
jgi:4-hydroxy-4-methyl-2-oxoglutarate aldolase